MYRRVYLPRRLSSFFPGMALALLRNDCDVRDRMYLHPFRVKRVLYQRANNANMRTDSGKTHLIREALTRGLRVGLRYRKYAQTKIHIAIIVGLFYPPRSAKGKSYSRSRRRSLSAAYLEPASSCHFLDFTPMRKEKLKGQPLADTVTMAKIRSCRLRCCIDERA